VGVIDDDAFDGVSVGFDDGGVLGELLRIMRLGLFDAVFDGMLVGFWDGTLLIWLVGFFVEIEGSLDGVGEGFPERRLLGVLVGL